MKLLIGYLIIGVVITALLLEREEGDTIMDYLHDAVVSIVGWPLFIIMSILDKFNDD